MKILRNSRFSVHLDSRDFKETKHRDTAVISGCTSYCKSHVNSEYVLRLECLSLYIDRMDVLLIWHCIQTDTSGHWSHKDVKEKKTCFSDKLSKNSVGSCHICDSLHETKQLTTEQTISFLCMRMAMGCVFSGVLWQWRFFQKRR